MQIGDSRRWFVIARDENGDFRQQDVDTSSYPLDDDQNEFVANMKRDGFSTMHIVHESGIPVYEMLGRVIEKHYERWEQSEILSKTNTYEV